MLLYEYLRFKHAFSSRPFWREIRVTLKEKAFWIKHELQRRAIAGQHHSKGWKERKSNRKATCFKVAPTHFSWHRPAKGRKKWNRKRVKTYLKFARVIYSSSTFSSQHPSPCLAFFLYTIFFFIVSFSFIRQADTKRKSSARHLINELDESTRCTKRLWLNF